MASTQSVAGYGKRIVRQRICVRRIGQGHSGEAGKQFLDEAGLQPVRDNHDASAVICIRPFREPTRFMHDTADTMNGERAWIACHSYNSLEPEQLVRMRRGQQFTKSLDHFVRQRTFVAQCDGVDSMRMMVSGVMMCVLVSLRLR